MKKGMKVLFLPTNVSGVNFWRMSQFFRNMKAKGVDAFYYNFEGSESHVGVWEQRFEQDQKLREEIYGLIKHSDIVVLQYAHLPVILALIQMFRKEFDKKILCETDDYIIDTPEYNPAFKGGFTPGNLGERLFMEQCRESDGIIVSTDYLGQQLERYNKNIDTIHNVIDFDKWDIKVKKSKKCRIGWVGGGNHEEDLKILLDVIPEIMSKYKNVEFFFSHGVPNYLKNVDGVKYTLGWANINKYPQFVANQKFDIGLAPLQINKFNMAKSNLRWLEYSALGIPTIATRIEPYEKSIVDGKTGFLCDTKDDWVDRISLLLDNRAKAQEIGSQAKEEVFKNYNLNKETDKYIKVLKRYNRG